MEGFHGVVNICRADDRKGCLADDREGYLGERRSMTHKEGGRFGREEGA